MGSDAYELGLVDELGGLKEALAHGVVLSGVDDYEIVEFPAAKNPMDAIADIFNITSLKMGEKNFIKTQKI